MQDLQRQFVPKQVLAGTKMKNENQIIVVLILLTLLSCHSNTSKKKKSFSLKESDKHDKTQDSISLQDYHAISFVYKPIININNKLYIMPSCNRWTDKDPVCAYIDLTDHTVHALLGFEYPSFPGADNKAKFSGVENDVSRCYDGKRFVSFENKIGRKREFIFSNENSFVLILKSTKEKIK